ncbi:MAG: DUF3592 domain-containing protein [Chloroflexota bacterium]
MRRADDDQHNILKPLIIFMGFLVFLVFYGSLLCGFWSSNLAMRSVVRDGTVTTATLETKYIDENGHYWLQYRFTTEDSETYVSVIDVAEAVYEPYQIGDVLDMRYASDNPNYNALDILQDDIRQSGWGILRMTSIVIGIIFVLGIAWMRHIDFVVIGRSLRHTH